MDMSDPLEATVPRKSRSSFRMLSDEKSESDSAARLMKMKTMIAPKRSTVSRPRGQDSSKQVVDQQKLEQLSRLILMQKNKHSSRCLLENVKKRESGTSLTISYHSLRMEDPSPYDPNLFQRTEFIRNHLQPYFSNVYFSLLAQSKNRRSIGKYKYPKRTFILAKQLQTYLNLPPLIGERLISQINANGDERIEHSEFVGFFLKLFTGSLDQKLYIAFRCYDQDGDELIDKSEVALILNHILNYVDRLDSTKDHSDEAHFLPKPSRVEFMNKQNQDHQEVQSLIENIFGIYPEGLYFDEFKELALQGTSELFFSVFSCLYSFLPCAHMVFLLRSLHTDSYSCRDLHNIRPKIVPLKPPMTSKMMDLITIQEIDSQQQLLLKRGLGSQLSETSNRLGRRNSFKGSQGALPPVVEPDLEVKPTVDRHSRRLSLLDQTRISFQAKLASLKEQQNAAEEAAGAAHDLDLAQPVHHEINSIKEEEEKSDSSWSFKVDRNFTSREELGKTKPNYRMFGLQTQRNTSLAHTKINTTQVTSSGLRSKQDSSSFFNETTGQNNLDMASITSSESSGFHPEPQPYIPNVLTPEEQPGSVSFEDARKSALNKTQAPSHFRVSAFKDHGPRDFRLQRLNKLKNVARTQASSPTNHAKLFSPTSSVEMRSRGSSSYLDRPQLRSSSRKKSNPVKQLFRRSKDSSKLLDGPPDESSLDERIQYWKRQTTKNQHQLFNQRIESQLNRFSETSFQQMPSAINEMETKKRISKYSILSREEFDTLQLAQIEKQKILQNIVERKRSSNPLSRRQTIEETQQRLQRLGIVLNNEESSSSSEGDNPVVDGFFLPLKKEILQMEDYYLQLTKHGYFRVSFMRLIDKDLYLFAQDPLKVRNSSNHERMIILMQGVHIYKKAPVFTADLPLQAQIKEFPVLYPVELHMEEGNQNFEARDQGLPSLLNPGEENRKPVFTFFFWNPHKQDEWVRTLQSLTNSYQISHFYILRKKGMKMTRQLVQSGHRQRPGGTKISMRNLMSDKKSEKKATSDDDESPAPNTNLMILRDGPNGEKTVDGVHKFNRKPVSVVIRPKAIMSSEAVHTFRQVIRLLKVIHHVNIMRLEDAFESQESFFLCYEKQSTQTYEQFVLENQLSLTEKRVQALFSKIVSAIAYLHFKGIVIRDLRAGSVIMTDAEVNSSRKNAFSKRAESSQPRLISLEEVRILSLDQKTTGQVGDVRYRAPEMVRGKPYNKKVDCWSLGVLLFFSLTGGKLPFDHEASSENSSLSSSGSITSSSQRFNLMEVQANQSLIEAQISSGFFDRDSLKARRISPSAIDLVSKLLEVNPEKRMDVAEVIKHEWMQLQLTPEDTQPTVQRQNSIFRGDFRLGSNAQDSPATPRVLPAIQRRMTRNNSLFQA